MRRASPLLAKLHRGRMQQLIDAGDVDAVGSLLRCASALLPSWLAASGDTGGAAAAHAALLASLRPAGPNELTPPLCAAAAGCLLSSAALGSDALLPSLPLGSRAVRIASAAAHLAASRA